MSLVLEICKALSGSLIGTYIRESDNLFSAIETVHVLGIVLTVGPIVLADLRLLGWTLRAVPVPRIVDPLVRVTWIGFTVMLSSGAVLFGSEAAKLYFNGALRAKLTLLGLAGANAAIFHATTYRRSVEWGTSAIPPPAARLAAASSLVLWSAIVVSGRAIAYA
jgi:hypothetical protein